MGRICQLVYRCSGFYSVVSGALQIGRLFFLFSHYLRVIIEIVFAASSKKSNCQQMSYIAVSYWRVFHEFNYYLL